MAEIVLAVVAHPDDEILGIGATLARHAMDGDRVEILIMATGATSRGAGADAVAALQYAAKEAAQCIGAAGVKFGGLPDQRLDTVPALDIVKLIEASASAPPTIVYTHHPGDLNRDHGVVTAAVMAAFRPMPGSSVRAIYAAETLSSTEWAIPTAANAFIPDHFVAVDQQMSRKMAALKAYAGEMRAFPHARSYQAVEALAQYRGAQVGVPAAEAFMTMRTIRR
jgi:N-acetylglucosamine malate deacetylase 1